MSPKNQRFVEEYLVDLNATAAYRRAGYVATGNAAEVNAARLLRNAQVAAAIDTRRKQLASRLKIDASRVLAEAWNILTADPRELVELHVDCCRHCYGRDHRYQRTVGEMERDRTAHTRLRGAQRKEAPAEFDERGGIGFDPRRAPLLECPECHGRGVTHIRLNDTRHLSATALSLYAGAKQGRDGPEVKLHSKLDALEKLSRHLGLNDRVKDGNAVMTKLAGTKTLTERGRVLIDAAATGDITVSQASQLMASLGTLAKLAEVDEFERRLAALEGARNA